MKNFKSFIDSLSLKINNIDYGLDDLSPVLSKDTLNYHYENLAKGYMRRIEKGMGDREFNRAGVFLHNKLFEQFMRPVQNNIPDGKVLNLINNKFDSFDNFKKEFKAKCTGIQGSGWCYLSTNGDIKTIPNHKIKNDILFIVDMWEHAFSLDYRWKKDEYIDNQWKIIDWSKINMRL